jgi:glycosyltransferase involved in cell wall biosynthesis
MQLLMLFILPSFAGGGAERVTINLLTSLHNRNYPVCIIVFNKSGPLLSMVPNDVPVYNLGTCSLIRSIVPLLKKIRQLNPKVIFSTLGYINMPLLAIRWLLPRKIEIWVREANLPSISLPNNMWPKLMNTLYRLLYNKADKLICTSTRMRDEFIKYFSVPESIIEILPNPVDEDKIRALSMPKERFDRGGVCYIAAGRLTFQKGFDRLLCWFSKLENKKSTLTILGDGVLKDELIRETESFNIQNRVKFIGFCDNPWKWYAGADVFLLSSRWEGMPNSVLESLACGTPVIATEESGGIKEITKQKRNNSVVIVSGAQQFVKAMNSVKIKNQNYQSNSLLPERYKRENVIHIIEGWLDEIK